MLCQLDIMSTFVQPTNLYLYEKIKFTYRRITF
jgi:hypothetical protein